MSITILIVDKKGLIKEVALKTYQESELYKKAGFKTGDGFEFQTEWGAEINGTIYSVSIFGKVDGKAGQENKYEFPPPIDNTLFFGSCVLVNKVNGQAKSVSVDEWTQIYDHLYGGFEDIDSEISEDDVDEDAPRTKEGYVKDDFIVDDDEEEEEEEEGEEEEEEEEDEEETSEEEVYKKKKPLKKTAEKKNTKSKIVTKEKKEVKIKVKANAKSKSPKTVFNVLREANDNYLDCTDELSEEDYI